MNKVQSPREKILLAAHDLFYQNGIRATGVDLIIRQANVTKVTFYRNFPSKDDLISAYLEYRHLKWITWFKESIENHKNTVDGLQVLIPVLRSWLDSSNFRGCAFINLIAEFGEQNNNFLSICKRHKNEMREIISDLLNKNTNRSAETNAIVIGIDGAIINTQIFGNSDFALMGLSFVLDTIELRQIKSDSSINFEV